MQRFRKITVLTLLGLPLLLSCRTESALAPPPAAALPVAQPGPDDVAVFRGGSVSRAELAAYSGSGAEPDPFSPSRPELTDWQHEAVIELAVRDALAREAPAGVPALEEAIRRGREPILRQAMAEELGWTVIRASEEEARLQFAGHPDQYRHPKRIRLQHIFLRAERHAMPQPERDKVREKLDQIRDEILRGSEFTGMARLNSQSADAESGGWMIISQGQNIDENFAREAWSLDLEELSEVIETPTGYQLAQLKEVLPGTQSTYEQVADFARRRATGEKLDAAQAEFMASAGRAHGLERHYERLTDRNIADDEPLLRIGDFRFTFAALREQLPDTIQLELYNRLFDRPRAFLDQIARNELLLREAERLELGTRPSIAARIAESERAARVEFALNLRLAASAARVSEELLRDYFRQNEERFQTLRTLDLSVLFLAASENEALWATLRRGEALAKRIGDGEDFGTLARQYSDHYSASRGGRIDELTDYGVGRLVQSRALFRRALARLKPGEMTPAMIADCYDPERLSFEQTGVLIVRLERENPPRQQTFEQVLPLVREAYLRRNYQDMALRVRQDIADEIELRILDERLSAL